MSEHYPPEGAHERWQRQQQQRAHQPPTAYGPPPHKPRPSVRRGLAVGGMLAAFVIGLVAGNLGGGEAEPAAAGAEPVAATPGSCLRALDLAEADKATPGAGVYGHMAADCRSKAATPPAPPATGGQAAPAPAPPADPGQPAAGSDPAPAAPAPEPEPEPAPEPAPEPEPEPAGAGEDPEVAAARGKAQDYLAFKGFCRPGLVAQLEYEGYSNAAAVAAVDSLGVDWAAETVRVAQSYVGFTEFSHDGLVQQLTYEGCEPAHAEQAATQVLGF